MKREPWNNYLLDSLAILADIPLQERIWIDGDYTIFVESPSELICRVFDDGMMDELLEGKNIFSDEADKIFREIHSFER